MKKHTISIKDKYINKLESEIESPERKKKQNPGQVKVELL